ncbi:MAG: pantoate--beta-alanine ligase [Lacipirellulaceae bacterium]
MLVLTEAAAARDWVRRAQAEGERVGVVPTMGALHAGHVSLATAALAECPRVVATVFVNPTQFGPGEDFARYPRDLAGDLAKLEAAGCGAVFAPAVETLYPTGAETTIDVGSVALPFEGAIRPTHFRGVATVVAKLLAILPADRAYFGQKDYQQTVVVRHLARDLCLPTEVVVCPTVREPDGLAMSSRNAYLSPDERERALCLSRALRTIERLVSEGQRDAAKLRAAGLAVVESTPGVEPQYLELVREGSVDRVEHVGGPTVVVVAARVGATRLIDNVVVG